MQSVYAARARHNALKRYRDADDPAIADARRDLRAAKLEDHIRQVVDQAPPLTPEQAERLAALLHGGGPT
ncbi:MAG TPA: hypothetical protein VK390_05065 [Propionibacteriaceae bacterium]|nr:hypothetical protein [Propionibacteriaceae bacterium]